MGILRKCMTFSGLLVTCQKEHKLPDPINHHLTGVASGVTSEKIQTWEILDNFSKDLKNLKIDPKILLKNWC